MPNLSLNPDAPQLYAPDFVETIECLLVNGDSLNATWRLYDRFARRAPHHRHGVLVRLYHASDAPLWLSTATVTGARGTKIGVRRRARTTLRWIGMW